MKLTINSKELLKAVQTVGGLIKPQNTMPILDNILVLLSESKMQIIADNLEVRSSIDVPVEFNGDYQVCLPYLLTISILKNLPNGPVDLIFDEKLVTVKSHTGEYKIPLNPSNVKEYPESKHQQAEDKITLNSLDFIEALRKAYLFVEIDLIVPALSNILVWISENDTKIVGCLNHLFYETTVDCKGAEKKLLLSKSVVSYLTSSISKEEDIEISYIDNHVFFKLKDRTISAVLGEGNYPNYQKNLDSITDVTNRTYTSEKDDLYPSIKRLVNVMDGSSSIIVLDFAGENLQMSYRSAISEFNAKEDIKIYYEGDPLVIGFNSKSLENIISTIAGQFEIKLASEKYPCIITSENTRALLAPYMLDSPKA